MPILTIGALCQEGQEFSAAESVHPEPSLFGTTDGKAIGTYLEHKFRAYLTVKDALIYPRCFRPGAMMT